MERQVLANFAIICALAFANSKVSGAQVVAQDMHDNGAALQSAFEATDSQRNTFAIIGAPSAYGVAEFARDVSNLQQESLVNIPIDAAGSGANNAYLSEAVNGQSQPTAYSENSVGTLTAENGTLALITLGIAALGLSRRRIRIAAAANGEAVLQATDRGAGDSDNADSACAPEPIKKTANSADRNPYPELRQSVQRLEALALEMTDLS